MLFLFFNLSVDAESELISLKREIGKLLKRQRELEASVKPKVHLDVIEIDQPSLFMADVQDVGEMFNQINNAVHCSTKDCRGKLVPTQVSRTRKGGGISMTWTCNGCKLHDVHFDTSLIGAGKRSLIGLAAGVASVISGFTFRQYERFLGEGLGMDIYSEKHFSRILEFMFQPVHTLLSGICEGVKDDMKQMPQDKVGSWANAVTTSDGVWLTRGFFSKNFTFSVWNYLTKGLLFFLHLSMRGKDSIIDEPLYLGTSKSAEGYAAEITFKQAKEEGIHIKINWADADSSAGSAFTEVFPKPKSKLMKCGGHVNRAHTNTLKEYSRIKKPSEQFISLHSKTHPEISSVQCVCDGKRHKKGCGCLSKDFITQARVNFFCALIEAGSSPKRFEQILGELSHHCHDEHKWKDGECSFHDPMQCSCGKCNKGERKCEGKEYRTKNSLKCPLHKTMYCIDLHKRASMATDIIHEGLGKGHANIPESAHNVLTRFRTKDKAFHRLHYQLSTNLGLIHANMPYLVKKHGANYHWIKELFAIMELPLFDGMEGILLKQNEKRLKQMEYSASDECKAKKTLMKQARSLEQAERRKWKQSRKHTYGNEDDIIAEDSASDSDEDEDNADGVEASGNVDIPEGAAEKTVRGQTINVLTPKKACPTCKGTDHQRRTSKKCLYTTYKGK